MFVEFQDAEHHTAFASQMRIYLRNVKSNMTGTLRTKCLFSYFCHGLISQIFPKKMHCYVRIVSTLIEVSLPSGEKRDNEQHLCMLHILSLYVITHTVIGLCLLFSTEQEHRGVNYLQVASLFHGNTHCHSNRNEKNSSNRWRFDVEWLGDGTVRSANGACVLYFLSERDAAQEGRGIREAWVNQFARVFSRPQHARWIVIHS